MAGQNMQDFGNVHGQGGDRGRALSARTILDSERYAELDRKQQWYEATSHDHKAYDFDGRMRNPGRPTSQPMLSSEQASFFVPMSRRRPSNPYRAAKVIVKGFSTMLFGYHRWPEVKAIGDEKTQHFVKALGKACRLRSKMIRARDLGGSMGTVGISWKYHEGKPRVNVHNAKHLYVSEWADREELKPAYVSEVYRYPVNEYDAEKRSYVTNWYWYRHDWSMDEEVSYDPCLYRAGVEPQWIVDGTGSVKHGLEETPFIWIQNLPTDEIDGECDYEGLYDNFEELDQIWSVIGRGAKLNLDPTLVLNMDPDYVARLGVRKGSDNALTVGQDGDAKYLELSGTSMDAGVKFFMEARKLVFEVAQLVLPDPNEVAADGMSRVAMELLYAPMIARADMLRDQYADAMLRLYDQMLKGARARSETERVVLPPRVVEDDVLSEEGNPTGEKTQKSVEHEPGTAEHIDLDWPDYFLATTDDQQKGITALSLAAGGKPIIDQQTATEETAKMFGKDPNVVWQRVAAATQKEADDNAQMMADSLAAAGGAPGAPGAPKPGGPPKPPGAAGKPAGAPPGAPGAPKPGGPPKPPKPPGV